MDVSVEVGHVHPDRVTSFSEVVRYVPKPLRVVPALGEGPSPVWTDGVLVEPVLEWYHLRSQADSPSRVVRGDQPDRLVFVRGVEEDLSLAKSPVVRVRLVGVLYRSAVLPPLPWDQIRGVVHQTVRVVLVPRPRPWVEHPNVLLGIDPACRDDRRGERGGTCPKYNVRCIRRG